MSRFTNANQNTLLNTELAKSTNTMVHLVSLEQNESATNDSATYLFTDAPNNITDPYMTGEVYGYKVTFTSGSTTAQIYSSSVGIDEAFNSIKDGDNVVHGDPIDIGYLQDNTTVTLGTKPNITLSNSALKTGRTLVNFSGTFIYQANGFLNGIDSVQERSTLSTGGIRLKLSGVDQTLIQDFLANGHLNRKVGIKRAFVDSNYAIIEHASVNTVGAVFRIFSGRVEGLSITESEDSVGVELDVANHWVDFNKTAGRRTNTNSQQRFFSGDLSMEFAPQTGKKLNWGGVAEIPTVPMAQPFYYN